MGFPSVGFSIIRSQTEAMKLNDFFLFRQDEVSVLDYFLKNDGYFSLGVLVDIRTLCTDPGSGSSSDFTLSDLFGLTKTESMYKRKHWIRDKQVSRQRPKVVCHDDPSFSRFLCVFVGIVSVNFVIFQLKLV